METRGTVRDPGLGSRVASTGSHETVLRWAAVPCCLLAFKTREERVGQKVRRPQRARVGFRFLSGCRVQAGIRGLGAWGVCHVLARGHCGSEEREQKGLSVVPARAI